MSEFQEDMIFKEVSEEDARIFLDILGKKSKKVKIMTTELRQLDPTTFVPDIILELDDEILTSLKKMMVLKTMSNML